MSKHTKGPWLIADGTFVYALNDEGCNSFWAGLQTSGKQAIPHQELEANARLIAAAPELLEALEAYQTAQAMPEFGDYSGFELAKRTMRYEGKPEWGHICEKHGIGYDGRCLCCEDDFKRHRSDNDRKARNARDDALREAARKAAAVIAKAKGEQ